MNIDTLGDGLGRRRRRKKSRGLGRARKAGKRRGRKICVRTAAGTKVCGVRWRKRRRK